MFRGRTRKLQRQAELTRRIHGTSGDQLRNQPGKQDGWEVLGG